MKCIVAVNNGFWFKQDTVKKDITLINILDCEKDKPVCRLKNGEMVYIYETDRIFSTWVTIGESNIRHLTYDAFWAYKALTIIMRLVSIEENKALGFIEPLILGDVR